MKKILSIGSIVEVDMKNLEQEVMIIGRFMKDANNNKMYDYMGVLYPYGFLDPEQIILFDEIAIKEIKFEGYINKEELELSNKLLEELEHKNEKSE